MRSLSDYFYRKSSFWVFLISLALFVIFMILVLPPQAARSTEVTGTNTSPDTSFYYTREQLYQIAEDYGQEGRYYYVDSRITFDIVWPLVYTLFLLNAISWILNKTIVEESSLRLLNLVPITSILFDFLENISNMVVMFRYPTPTDWLANIAGIFTSLKWITLSAGFLILIIGVLLWVGVRTNIIKT